jgi:mono/diheme cytochrome c family protein
VSEGDVRCSRPVARSLLALSLAGGLAAFLAGCKVRPPGPLETAVMTRVKRHVTVGGAQEQNPIPDTADEVRAGQAAFGSYCIACHGLDGQGTGVPFAQAMSPPVPKLTATEVQAYSDGQLKWIIENGLSPSGMPAARGILNDEEMWRIVRFIRHLPPAGSLGEPAFYGGDGPSASRSAR